MKKALSVFLALLSPLAFSQYARYPSYAFGDLSNLTSPTSVNQSLLPSGDNTLDLGSGTLPWATVYTRTGVKHLTASGTNGVTLTTASGMSSSYTLKFPAAIGASNQALQLGGDLTTLAWFTPTSQSTINNLLADNVSAKVMVIAASTANVASLSGANTIDGIDTFTNPGPYLLKNQTDATQNGIWIAQSGAWTRDVGMPDTGLSAQGALVSVIAGGTTNGNTLWFCDGDGSNATFKQIAINSGASLTQSRLKSAAASLSTATTANVTASSLALTAGDWEVYGSVGFSPGATTSITKLEYAISATSATLPATDTTAVYNSTGEIRGTYDTAANVAGGDITFTLPPSRVTVSSSQTLYLVAQGTFTVSTLTAYGRIYAVRVK